MANTLQFDHRMKIIGVVGVPDIDDGETIESVRRDLHALQEGGVDGLLIENLGDTFRSYTGNKGVVDFFRRVMDALREEIVIPLGVCLLPNHKEYVTDAFKIADEYDADFTWLDTFVDKASPTYTPRRYEPLVIEPDPREILGHKTTRLFTEIQPRNFYRMLEEKPIEYSAEEAKRNGADSIVVVRDDTYTEDRLSSVRAAVGPSYPLGITGRLDASNIQQYVGRVQYGVIYAFFRVKQKHENRVNAVRVKNLMSLVRR